MEKQQASEDLQFIRQVMEDSRRTVADNGMHYINWSVVTALGIIGTYIIARSQLPGVYILWNWAFFIITGWIFTFRIGRKYKTHHRMSFADKILTSVWISSGISMTLIAFAGILTNTIHPASIPAFIATIIGIPFFISGIVYNLNWFKMLAGAWWTTGLIFFLWQSFHTLAVFGVLILLFQALPGFILYRKFNRERESLKA